MSNVIEQIKKQIDIVDVVSEYIDLSKKGRNFWALCPFHEDSNPSMSVSPDKQLFKCFVCGAGGDAIKFVSEYEKISFPEALSKLGAKVGVKVEARKTEEPKYSVKEQEMLSVMKEAIDFFQYSLVTEEGAKALEYAEKRRLNSKIREDFLIGYAPNSGLKEFLVKKGYDVALLMNSGLVNQRGKDFFRNRLIFGITNEYGQVVAFSARDLSGESSAKYINSPESKLFAKSRTLYNFANAKDIMRKEKLVFINEGFMDVIAMNRAGFRNSIAIMGTALTKEHVSYLMSKVVVLMLDSDAAGINATVKSIKTLLDAGITTKVVQSKEGKDPDELLESLGVEGFRENIENQIDALEFIFQMHQKKFVKRSPSTIREFITSFAKYLSNTDDMTKDFYVNKLVEELKISKEIILEEIPIKFKKTIVTKPQYSKPQYKTEEVRAKQKIRHRNYSYELILSMIKKPFLVNCYKDQKNEIIFKEASLLAIANFLVDLSNGSKTKPSRSLKLKVNEIMKYNEYVETVEEFNELIQRINLGAKESLDEAFSVKLKDISNSDDRVELLEQMRKSKGNKNNGKNNR